MNYDFSKITIQDYDRLREILVDYGSLSQGFNKDYSTGATATALDNLRYGDMLSADSVDQHNLSRIYSAIQVSTSMERVELNCRLHLIAFLCANDANGVYTDDDIFGEGQNPLTLGAASTMVCGVFAE